MKLGKGERSNSGVRMEGGEAEFALASIGHMILKTVVVVHSLQPKKYHQLNKGPQKMNRSIKNKLQLIPCNRGLW